MQRPPGKAVLSLIAAACATAVLDAGPDRWVRVLRDANYTGLQGDEDQSWKPVARGSVEEVAAEAACHFAARRIRAGSPKKLGDR